MHKILKSIFILLMFGLFTAMSINLLTDSINSKSKVSYEKISNSLLKDVSLESAGVFLYTSNYKTRYIFAANTDILNPVVDIENDSFFPTLLQYNKKGVCTIIKTTNLPTDSSLYIVLKEKGNISDNWFYIACPIFTQRGNLAGYLSQVFENDDQISVYVQQVNYYTRIVENNLKNIL